MTKAAKHLTPVALELGSKCPCIVDRLDSSRDSQVRPPCALLVLQFRDRTPACVPRQNDIDADYTQVAVNRIIGAKWSTCSGQACIAIDYVLVEEEFAPILVCTLQFSPMGIVFQSVHHPMMGAYTFSDLM